MKSAQATHAFGRWMKMPTAMATDADSPSRLISGPLPWRGGNQR